MPRRTLAAAALVLALAGPAAAQDKLTLKAEAAPPPNELSAAVRAVLDAQALSVSDEAGKLLCTVWPRKELASKAAADKVRAGLTYTDLEETTVVGAVRFPDGWSDYRKQKIKPGVYTLRLAIQPMDGDHMGTAPYNEFCLTAPADKDTKPDAMGAKALHELSAAGRGGSHPGIMLLYPNPKPADAPAVEAKGDATWVLNFKRPVAAAGQKAAMGFSLVVAGNSAAE